MATKKAASSKKSAATTHVQAAPSKKPTTTKITTVKASSAASATKGRMLGGGKFLPENVVNVVFAELAGTFALTLVAVLTLSSLAPLYVGLAIIAIVLGVGAISGAHINPAVTFGLWTARRIPVTTAAFYWIAQFLGAMAAVVVLNLISDGMYAVQFSNIDSLSWAILAAELIGTAVFMFGFMAAVNRKDTSSNGVAKAFGVGLSFMLGLLVAMSLTTAAQSGIDQMQITSVDDVPHELRNKGPILNPAVAIATTENTDTQLQGGSAQSDEAQVSRFSLETILGSLLGAAIGANLYLLTRDRFRR